MSTIELKNHHQLVREDMARLRSALDDVLPDSLGKQEQSRILNLACGECWEAETLIDVLGSKKDSTQVELVGVDIREKELLHAEERLNTLSDPKARTSFILDSATDLDQHVELKENFDLVFLRHQNMYNGRKLWEEIFDQGLGRLSKDGHLVITSYFDHEHELAIDALTRLGAKMISNKRQMRSRELAYVGKSVDRHIAVFQIRE